VCDLGVGIYLVPSTLALLESPEHGFAMVVGKICRHYAPLPLVPLPTVRLPGRTATCPAGASPEHDREPHGKDTGSAHNLKAAGGNPRHCER
jgi:hypothetical protein